MADTPTVADRLVTPRALVAFVAGFLLVLTLTVYGLDITAFAAAGGVVAAALATVLGR